LEETKRTLSIIEIPQPCPSSVTGLKWPLQNYPDIEAIQKHPLSYPYWALDIPH